ncbi:MAG: hypothetical protein ICV87_01915 [Gemmatimonadetes bacterium]|nr:hypothetical protein [Gemmatimonadota bacterium]
MRRKQLFFYAVLVALVLGFAEAASAAACAVLVKRGWMARLPRLSDEQLRLYFTHRNPHLGWGPAVDGAGRVLRLQPRPDPAFADTLPPCAAAYGESFTAGSEVGEDGAYPHVLGVELGCRVANYGVGASGSDQALMLFRAQRHLDRAPVVILGHISENILRNVNQYRVLLYPDQELYLKPRFLLERGELRFVPVPVRTAAELRALPDHPERFLAHDAFMARPRPGFPYTWALVRWGLRDFHVRAQLAGIPRHLPFYDVRHPAGGLPLTTEILATFHREARAEGRRPLVALMPVGRDFVYARRTGRWPDQPLADALRSRGVAVLHAGPEMLRRLPAGTDPCTLFADCSAHYNAAGYRLFAEVVRDRLRADAFTRAPAPPRAAPRSPAPAGRPSGGGPSGG